MTAAKNATESTGYKTKARAELADLISHKKDKIFKASELAKELSNSSLSTVYRNLQLMEKTGFIQSFGTDENKEICYRYIGPGDCQNKIHLICRKCGKFFHLEGTTLQKVKKLIEKECGFYVNQQESCLFGYCSSCYGKESQQP